MFLGVDIGGTNTDIVAYDGKFKHLGTFKTSEVIDKLPKFLKNIVPNIKAIGVGIAAWIKNSEFIHAPNLPKIPHLEFDIPFVVENDANCFAYFASKTVKSKNLLGITVGTGIGSGIIIDGKIYRGCGLAGEIGHTFVGGDKHCKCGGRGHLEAYFGGWALGSPEVLLKTGKIYVTKEFETFCISIANAVMILNPEAVALGGRIGGRLDVKILEERVSRYLPEVFFPSFYSIKDDFAVAKGACLLAMTSTLENR